jgi:hypothetical protein
MICSNVRSLKLPEKSLIILNDLFKSGLHFFAIKIIAEVTAPLKTSFPKSANSLN